MWRIAFVAVFFGLTLLPGLQMLTGLVPIPPVDENRTLAPPVTAATPLDAIPRVADRWFADHFGLRPILIRLKTQVDFSVFGMSDRVLVGRDGQLFYRSTLNVEEPYMERALVTAEAPAIAGIDRLTRALKAAGIQTAFVINMMSDRFYPELLPSSAVRRPAVPRIDEFVAKLRALPAVTFVDSTEILRTAMKSRRIFHLTDFHWNDPAAYPVGKALVDEISKIEGRPTSVWTHPLKIVTQRGSGGIAMFMPLFVPPSEDMLMIGQTWDWPAGFTQAARTDIFEHSTQASPDPRLLPPTVFVGDSFLDGMLRSGVLAYFVETHRIRWKAGLKISEIIAALPADTRWLVIQFIEVGHPAIAAFADTADIDAAIKLIEQRPKA